MKKIANGNIIFITWDELDKAHKKPLGDTEYNELWRAFRNGLVIAIKKKGRYNLWTQINDAHKPWNKLFEEPHWGERLNTLKGWKKEVTKVLLENGTDPN